MAIQEAPWVPARTGVDDDVHRCPPDLRWAAQAACRGSSHLYFAPDRERPGRRARRETAARSLCATCPVLTPCRAWARANREYGFWGGESEAQRTAAGYRPVLVGALTRRAGGP
jgi:WhiB family transcriptional regulator, redox-sensing transcriptional regulator